MESNYTDTVSGEELYINIGYSGSKFYYKDQDLKIAHRLDGPAVEYDNGGKAWYVDGQLHRVDGPAFEYVDGTKVWYVDGKRHRIDGPAFESADGTKLWYVDGKRHRLDGPAIEYAEGDKLWFVDGVFIFEVNKNNKLVNRMQ
jgi:uncharacterized Fe-S cluster-containing protein